MLFLVSRSSRVRQLVRHQDVSTVAVSQCLRRDFLHQSLVHFGLSTAVSCWAGQQTVCGSVCVCVCVCSRQLHGVSWGHTGGLTCHPTVSVWRGTENKNKKFTLLQCFHFMQHYTSAPLHLRGKYCTPVTFAWQFQSLFTVLDYNFSHCLVKIT